MKQLLNKPYSQSLAVVWNLLLVYLVYQIARLAYYVENASYFNYTFDVFRGGLMFDTSAIIYTNALWLLLMFLPFRLDRFCKWYYLVVNSLALAINLADAVYFQYTMRRTTTTVFSEFSNEGNLGSIVGTEFLRHWYFVLLFVIIVYALWRLYAIPRKHHKANMAVLLIVIPLSIAGIRGGFTTAVRPITISNANQYAQRPTDAALVLNTPFSLIRTIGKNVFEVPHYFDSQQELESVYTPVHSFATIDTVGFARKNVVILIVESFGREYIGALNKNLDGGRYQGYTPFVDSLISKSLTFRYSFCNGRKSIDGMPSILSGIPMFIEPFILTPASMNQISGIASLLDDEGYETAFFHGAQRGSMGFQAFSRATGFQNYYGREDFNADSRFNGDKDFDGTWAIWDEPFLQYFAVKMSEMKQPFMTAVFTASSHHPYAVPDQYKDVFPEEGIEIHKCIRYTDMAIRKFFEKVNREPWFKNTIFILTSDHTNLSDHRFYQTDIGGFCSPIIIYEPSEEKGEIQDKIAQQTDILPTVMGMLHYKKPFVSFGIDLLNTPADQTWAVNYLNGIYQYVKHGYVLQFDGKETVGMYALNDSLMQHNLVGTQRQQQPMEQELKAIIQQYMERMVNDRLTPDSQ
jgi:phosphoglycerol transferase MdoB-like AlkP superfamily enzyme